MRKSAPTFLRTRSRFDLRSAESNLANVSRGLTPRGNHGAHRGKTCDLPLESVKSSSSTPLTSMSVVWLVTITPLFFFPDVDALRVTARRAANYPRWGRDACSLESNRGKGKISTSSRKALPVRSISGKFLVMRAARGTTSSAFSVCCRRGPSTICSLIRHCTRSRGTSLSASTISSIN